MNRFFQAMSRFREFLRVRFGIDSKALAMLIAAIVCATVARYTGFWPLTIVAFVLLILVLLSVRGISPKRLPSMLRAGFSRFTGRMKSSASAGKSRRADTEHKYYHCPQCSKMLRVPKGKGKIEIRCTCGRTFVRKT